MLWSTADIPKGFCEFEGRHWYETGDYVKEDSDNNLIFCGRKKRFVKLAGEMISFPAIEGILRQRFTTNDESGPTIAVEANSRGRSS